MKIHRRNAASLAIAAYFVAITSCKSASSTPPVAPRPFPSKAQMLSAGTSMVPLGARVMQGMVVGEPLEESAFGPWTDGVSDFTHTTSSSGNHDIVGALGTILSGSFGMRRESFANIHYEGVRSRQVKSLDALGQQSGTYVWKAWYVRGFSAEVRSGGTDSGKIAIKTDKAASLGIDITAKNSDSVTMNGQSLALAVLLIDLHVAPAQANTRISLTSGKVQSIGFGYSIQVVDVREDGPAGTRVSIQLFNPRSTVLTSAPKRLSLERGGVVQLHHTAETLSAGADEDFNEVRDLITFEPQTAFEGKVLVQRSMFRARPSEQLLEF